MGLGNFIGKITGTGFIDGDGEGTEFNDDTPTVSSRFSDDFGYGSSSTSKPTGSKVLSIAATTHLQVIVFKPQKYSEAAEIADHFKSKKTIVLNLENTNKDVANRLIDFLGGVAYAGDGDLKRISNTTYMIVPFNVEISGDTIEELESSSDLF
ncbi:MAG: cell division protein SepF [Oscillospiraceae bacterium]|nr:cell division protein SepF [Oscillospiraceae bacterium]